MDNLVFLLIFALVTTMFVLDQHRDHKLHEHSIEGKLVNLACELCNNLSSNFSFLDNVNTYNLYWFGKVKFIGMDGIVAAGLFTTVKILSTKNHENFFIIHN